MRHVESRTVIGRHRTGTDDGSWDADANVARLPNDAEALRAAHAWVDEDGDPDAKSSYKFPHHFVSESGQVGDASTVACSAGIAALNGARGGADIPEAEREGVWEHLAGHLRDAGVQPPPLRGVVLSRPVRVGGRLRELRRYPSALEVRGREDATATVVGYAALFDHPYVVQDWLGEFTETIERGAFSKTLAEADVRFFFDHDGLPLARSRSGTLLLEQDERGLRYEASLDLRQQAARDLVLAIERGDVDQSSFAFTVVRETWSEDYSERTIHEVKLWDVSAVAFPANEDTSVALRADELLRAVSVLEPRAFAELREGKVLSAANEQLVRDAIAALEALLASAAPKTEEEASRDAGINLDTAVRQIELLRRRGRSAPDPIPATTRP